MNRKQSVIKGEEGDNPLKYYSLQITTTDLMFQRFAESLGASAVSALAARDKADAFNIALAETADREPLTIKPELVDYAECLKAVEDRRQDTLETINERIKPALDRWKAVCTEALSTLKTTCLARDKDMKALKALEKSKPKEGSKKAEQVTNDIITTKAAIAAKNAEVVGLMTQFHQQRITDYKNMLALYAQIQMTFHSRALEFYTRGYQDILDIQSTEYVESVLNESLATTMGTPQLDRRSINSINQSMNSVNTP